MGWITSQIAMMSNLCESSVVWLLVVMIVLPYVFHCTLMFACHIHSTARLDLHNNNFTGVFMCPAFIEDCYISCSIFDIYLEDCHSL
jgi:hypothetical protein